MEDANYIFAVCAFCFIHSTAKNMYRAWLLISQKGALFEIMSKVTKLVGIAIYYSSLEDETRFRMDPYMA